MKVKIMQSSVIQFSVANFGCFRDRVDFSMVGNKTSKNTFPLLQTNDQLFRTAVIYGPNASGKSTLIKAMRFMKTKIQKSTNEDSLDKTSYQPFLLEENYDEKSSFFEIIFLIGIKVYRYNFSLLKDHTIVEENLYQIKKTSEITLFTRNKENININNKFTKDNLLKSRTNSKYLFLSVANQWDEKVKKEIVTFFNDFNILDGNQLQRYVPYTAEEGEKNANIKKKILEYLKNVDIPIFDFQVREQEIPEELQKLLKKDKDIQIPKLFKTVYFKHAKYNKNRQDGFAEINASFESDGTRTYFGALGPLIDTLSTGAVLFIDEINSSLHPFLCQFIVELFHSKKTNPRNAQLIFTTHDISLLSDKSIDRDQFWFTERDRHGIAKLFSLSEFKDRKDGSDFQTRYLTGRYGALPFIDDSFLKE